MIREPMRSPLGQALGLGSAKNGVEHWWLQRVTAIALVPLTVWFAASLIAHAGNNYATVVVWLRTPTATIPMTLLLTALFYHTALGLQVVIEDYLHSRMKIPALLSCALAALRWPSPASWRPCASLLVSESDVALRRSATTYLQGCDAGWTRMAAEFSDYFSWRLP